MSNRRASELGDSLELLLDTICNAFGGILFLSILLTMLLRLSHPKSTQPVSEPARLEMIEVGRQLDVALSELETLERSLAIQMETRARLADADLEARYSNLEELRRRRRDLERSVQETRQEAARTQQRVDAIAAQQEALIQKLEKTKSDVAATTKQLATERGRRTQSVVPPHSRSSNKQEVAFIVRYGRIYQQHRWDNVQFTREPNLDDFVVLGETDGHVRLTPKPYRGLLIEDSPEFAQNFRAKLVPHSPGQWHVCLAVWEDSFDKFQELKRLLIQSGYDMRILALSDGESLLEGIVPNPQVQ